MRPVSAAGAAPSKMFDGLRPVTAVGSSSPTHRVATPARNKARARAAGQRSPDGFGRSNRWLFIPGRKTDTQVCEVRTADRESR